MRGPTDAVGVVRPRRLIRRGAGSLLPATSGGKADANVGWRTSTSTVGRLRYAAAFGAVVITWAGVVLVDVYTCYRTRTLAHAER